MKRKGTKREADVEGKDRGGGGGEGRGERGTDGEKGDM